MLLDGQHWEWVGVGGTVLHPMECVEVLLRAGDPLHPRVGPLAAWLGPVKKVMAEREGGLEHPWGYSSGNRSRQLVHCTQRHPCCQPMQHPPKSLSL